MQTKAKNNLSQIILISAIFIFSIFFRTFNLSISPPSIFSDEVDIGYQAITFNRTFTDYFGNKFPLFFQSFADWHTPFAILPVAFFQKIIGVNIYSLKLPSIIFGILSIIILYITVLKITKSRSLAILSFFFMAFSPWHIHYSRTNFESVTGMLLFLIIGIYFWSRFIQSKSNKFLTLSLVSFSLTPYFYSTAKLFIAFIFISLFIVWRKDLLKISFKQFLLPGIFCLITLVPLILNTLFTDSNSRFSYISIFTDPTIASTVNYERFSDTAITNYGEIGISPNIFSKIFNNKITIIGRTFLKNYFSSFSTEFLIIKGDTNLRQGFGNQGYIFYFDYFIIFLGIFYGLKTNKKFSRFFLLLLFFTPIPFSLTRDADSAHATRLILMLPSLIYFLSFGYQKILQTSKIVFVILIGIFLFNFSFFWHNYNLRYPQLSARYWHTGLKEIILEANSQKNNFPKIFFSNRDESMIPFFLYYTQYQSEKLPSSPVKSLIWNNFDYFNGMELDQKYYFGLIDWSGFFSKSNDNQNSLFVVNSNEYEIIKDRMQHSDVQMVTVSSSKNIFQDNLNYYLITFKWPGKK